MYNWIAESQESSRLFWTRLSLVSHGKKTISVAGLKHHQLYFPNTEEKAGETLRKGSAASLRCLKSSKLRLSPCLGGWVLFGFVSLHISPCTTSCLTFLPVSPDNDAPLVSLQYFPACFSLLPEAGRSRKLCRAKNCAKAKSWVEKVCTALSRVVSMQLLLSWFCFLFSAIISNKPGHKRLFVSALPPNELAAYRKGGRDDRITNKPCFDSFWGFQVALWQVLT